MIAGLPEKANIREPVPKKLVYETFGLSAQERSRFDESVHRMVMVGEISEHTVTILPGKEVPRIFIIEVELQSRKYDSKSISFLFKLINQSILLILRYGDEYRFAVFKGKLIEGDWDDIENLCIVLDGVDMDAVWDNIVKKIGSIEVQEGRTLSDQIYIDEQVRKISSQIDALTKRMHREKQPRKKHALFEEIAILEKRKTELNGKTSHPTGDE